MFWKVQFLDVSYRMDMSVFSVNTVQVDGGHQFVFIQLYCSRVTIFICEPVSWACETI